MSAVDTYLEHNAEFAAARRDGHLPPQPTRKVAILACMDARLEPAALLGLAEGDAHVIRNAGGVVTDDVIRSLTLSQRLGGTREIMLIHHTDCALLTISEDEMAATLEKETGVSPSFAMEAFDDLEDDVRLSMKRLYESPFLLHKDDVRGFVYDVSTGRLREVR